MTVGTESRNLPISTILRMSSEGSAGTHCAAHSNIDMVMAFAPYPRQSMFCDSMAKKREARSGCPRSRMMS